MTDSYALLADPVSNGTRTSLLKADTADIQVRATVLAGEDDLLLVRLRLGSEMGYVYLVIDDRGFIPVKAVAANQDEAYAEAHKQLERLGYTFDASKEDYSLLADLVTNGRRSSVLQDDHAQWALRAKVIHTDDDELYLHLRVWYTPRGYVHLVVHADSSIVAITTGGKDKDAWERMRGELGRRDIVVD